MEASIAFIAIKNFIFIVALGTKAYFAVSLK